MECVFELLLGVTCVNVMIILFIISEYLKRITYRLEQKDEQV